MEKQNETFVGKCKCIDAPKSGLSRAFRHEFLITRIRIKTPLSKMRGMAAEANLQASNRDGIHGFSPSSEPG